MIFYFYDLFDLMNRAGVSNIRPAGQNRPVARLNLARGMILQVKASLFAWEVYPVRVTQKDAYPYFVR